MHPERTAEGNEADGEERKDMGKIVAICISEKKGTQKYKVNEAEFVEDWGIRGDAHAGKWHRQVSLLSRDRIEEFRARGAQVEDGAFGENLVVEGFDFASMPIGSRFRCGDVVLELTQIGKECHHGCAIFQKMGDCIMPREGVFAKVLHGGVIREGDELARVPSIFETHAHYDDEAFDVDRETILASMQEQGIGTIVNVCAAIDGLNKTIALTEKYPFVYGAVGVHPDDAENMTEETLAEIRKLSRLPKVLAIGEIGLDYYWHKEERVHEIQKKMFRAQMEIAREERLPFMIHSREAAKDTLDIVREFMEGGMYGGIIHCFSYGKEIAQEYLKMGLYLGIGGVVTFKNAKKLKEVVESAPLEQIVLETDSPYLSPEPNRGKRNSSLNLPYIAAQIAEIKKVTPEEVIRVTRKNAEKLLFCR